MAISASEYQAAERVVLRLAQLESFPAQAHDKQLSTLTPFTQDDMLRVGGRLEFADLSFNQRHPIILSSRHWISELLIRDLHRRYFHAGIRFITYMLKLRFWFVGSIQPRIKKCVNNCVPCIRHNRQLPLAPLMGALPETRVRSTYPFDTVGIDFAGPLTTRLTARTKTTLKSYVAVFICFASKAVHLEAVSALSTPAFLAALKRFTARRGYPSILYSDNGTNFVGGASELEKQTNILLKEDAVQNFASLHQIDWRFNPPAAPHMGGLWESAVRITKYHLYRVTSTHVLNFEELSTFLCQIEAIMNSRPLTAIQSENTPLILTPGHFLIGRPLVCIPDSTSDGAKLNYVQRWTLISQLRVNFWRAWKRDYLTTLQKRSKWSTKSQSLKVNDVVLLRDEDTPPLLWPLARISNIYPGKDNIVRVVDVVTSNGRTLRRPVVKLIPLFNINEEQ